MSFNFNKKEALCAYSSACGVGYNCKYTKETLINCLCGILRWAHGAQKSRHINRIVEVAILRTDTNRICSE